MSKFTVLQIFSSTKNPCSMHSVMVNELNEKTITRGLDSYLVLCFDMVFSK